MKLLLLALALLLGCGDARARADALDPGLLKIARLVNPGAPVRGLVFLLSDGSGWSKADDTLADELASDRAIVVGVDLPQYLQALGRSGGDCVYMVSDLESVAQQLQRAAGAADYHLPIVAGRGAGGGLALAIAAQTPAATIGHTLALDPQPGVALRKVLCSDAPRRQSGGGTVYGLSPGPLPDPVDVILSARAPEGVAAHVESLVADGFAISVAHEAAADAAFDAKLRALVAQHAPATETTLDVPVHELPGPARFDSLAIVYSGDGGWRDLDKTIAGIFQKSGLPAVGVDSLRYFWSEKSPSEVSRDLAGMIDLYTAKWNVKHVALVGYSFGADILPSAFNGLDDAHKARVAQISLLGFSPRADFEISVAGWLGSHTSDARPTLPELAKIDGREVQCIYGADEDDTACPGLKGTPVEVIETAGGHHFDGNYQALADTIMAGLRKRLQASPAQ